MDAWVERTGDGENDRVCGRCFYYAEGKDGFLPGSKAFTGHCTHPARQLPCNPQPFVRERELACRLSWDRDLYQEKEDGDDHVLDIRTIDPAEPGPEQNGKPRNALQRLLTLKDARETANQPQSDITRRLVATLDRISADSARRRP